MTSQIEKGLDEEALLIAQKAAEDAYMAEVYEGLAFDGAITAGIRAYLTATGESKTESSPDVTEASMPVGAKWCQPGDMQQEQYFLVRFDDPDCKDSVFTDWPSAKAFYAQATLSWNCWLFASVPTAALSVGREGAAQGRAVRVKPLVWTGDHSYTVASIVASSLVGKYTANVLGAAYHQGQLIGSGDSIHAAEALCQSDYTARILSALDTSPEGMVEERI